MRRAMVLLSRLELESLRSVCSGRQFSAPLSLASCSALACSSWFGNDLGHPLAVAGVLGCRRCTGLIRFPPFGVEGRSIQYLIYWSYPCITSFFSPWLGVSRLIGVTHRYPAGYTTRPYCGPYDVLWRSGMLINHFAHAVAVITFTAALGPDTWHHLSRVTKQIHFF